MGVYIKGIKMPTDERILIVFPSGRVLEVSADAAQDIFRETQAISVSPHGDLISRTELIKNDHQHYEYLSDEFYVTVRDIEAAPIIVPADEE